MMGRSGPKARSVRDRFMERFSVDPSGCWLWQGCKLWDGYGALHIGKVPQRAHRVAYGLFKGPIPKGAQVCHKCDRPLCVNPDHLWLGNAFDNMRDCVAKGRHGSVTSPGSAPKGEDNPATELTRDDVLTMRGLYILGVKQVELARVFNIYQGSVSRILRRATWSHV